MCTDRTRGSVAVTRKLEPVLQDRLVACLYRQPGIDGMQPGTHHADQQRGGGERGDATRTQPAEAAGNIVAIASGGLAKASLPDLPVIASNDRSCARREREQVRRKRFRRLRQPRRTRPRVGRSSFRPRRNGGCTLASVRVAVTATLSSTAAKCLNWALRRHIGGSAGSARASASSPQSNRWTPCTTGTPACVRRARTASRCIGLRSPETAANRV